MTEQKTVEMEVGKFRVLVELAGVARNPAVCGDISPFMGGTARANYARRIHDEAKNKLREIDDD